MQFGFKSEYSDGEFQACLGELVNSESFAPFAYFLECKRELIIHKMGSPDVIKDTTLQSFFNGRLSAFKELRDILIQAKAKGIPFPDGNASAAVVHNTEILKDTVIPKKYKRIKKTLSSIAGEDAKK